MVKGCILPWIHLFGDVGGTYRLCCHIRRGAESAAPSSTPISSVFNNENYKNIRKEFLEGSTPGICKEV